MSTPLIHPTYARRTSMWVGGYFFESKFNVKVILKNPKLV